MSRLVDALMLAFAGSASDRLAARRGGEPMPVQCEWSRAVRRASA
jgi:hypothetical protein